MYIYIYRSISSINLWHVSQKVDNQAEDVRKPSVHTPGNCRALARTRWGRGEDVTESRRSWFFQVQDFALIFFFSRSNLSFIFQTSRSHCVKRAVITQKDSHSYRQWDVTGPSTDLLMGSLVGLQRPTILCSLLLLSARCNWPVSD